MECRKEQTADSGGSLGNGDVPLRALEISDSVAEGVLTCLEELLKKCHLGSANQVHAPELFFFFAKWFLFIMVRNTLCFLNLSENS